MQRARRWPEMFRTFFLSRLLFSFENDGRSPLFIFGTLPLVVPFEAMAAVTRAKEASQTSKECLHSSDRGYMKAIN